METQNTTIVFQYLAIFAVIGFIIYSVRRVGGLGAVFSNSIKLVNGAEGAWMNFIAAVVPYGVSFIPANMTYDHVQSQLGFSRALAWDAGIVIELFGVVAMHTIIKFWQNNKKYTSDKSEKRAPLGSAIFSYSFYLAIVLIVNVVLEIMAGARDFWGILAIALFSLLGIPSGVLVAIRAQHREMLDSKNQHTYTPPADDPQRVPKNVRPRHASEFKEQMLTMLENEYSKNGQVLELTAITNKLKLDHNNAKGFVSTVRTEWMKEKGIQKSDKKNPLSY